MLPAQGVVAFDLDGTLVPGTSVCLHLAPWLGHDELPELERRYAAGEITNHEVAERDAIFYAGRSRREVWDQLVDVPVIAGIRATVEWLKRNRLVPVIATVTWRGSAEFFKEKYAFRAASGCELQQEADGTLSGQVARHFEAADKVSFVRELAEAEGLGFDRVVAIGDSTSDIPLFREAGLAIALNATRNARDAAHVSLETDDLREVIPTIESFFATT
ncbi:MAG: phosphoserine phosphatase [Actinomycetota bacterium]|jgi:phosphoserine phosphatase|nr:phosphoserine phosphatase [Actinomycetota bacterium]